MNEPVFPTPRKRLSVKQRVESFDRNGATCCICNFPIAPGEPFIDEHKIPLALGGSNDPGNRGIAHIQCARVKTRTDQSMIAKAIRMRAKHLGIKNPNRRKIRSRGFGR